MLFLIVVGWIVCSFVSYGLILGGFTHRFPYFRQAQNSFISCLFGPVSLLSALIFLWLSPEMRWYWRVRPLTKAERWAAHKNEWPSLTYDDFELTD